MSRKEFSLYELCLEETAQLLKSSTYWDLNWGICNNPFNILPSTIIDELIIYVTRLSVAAPLQSTDLHYLLVTGRVRNFKLEDINMNAEELEYILLDLSSSCQNLISIKIKNVFCSYTYRMNLRTYALECLLIKAQNIESVESCIEFNLNVLSNSANLKKLVLHFPVENQLFDFLEVDGEMVHHNSLRVLEIYEDARHPISYLDVAVILRYCNELVEINCDISKSLEYMHSEYLHTGILTSEYKLQKCCLGSIYLNTSQATVSKDGVYIAALCCPYLREVDVLVKDFEAIHALSEFHHLSSLLLQWEMLHGGDYHLGIHPLLEKSEFGHSLKSLHIIHFSNVDFSSVGVNCPNLEELRVEYSSEFNRFTFLPTSFQKLINLHVEPIYEEDCEAHSLTGLLSNATKLKYLTIRYAGMLTDSVLGDILKKNSLSELKELRISNCVLSIQGMQNLVASLTALEYFEMSGIEINFDLVATVIHEINPRVILSCTSE